MSGNKNHPTSIRAAAEALMAALSMPNDASPPASAELIAAMDWMDQALGQPEVSAADLIERAAWAEEGIAKMKAGDAVLPIHIQAIVTAAEAGLQAHRSFGVRWAADMRAIERWRAGKPSREIGELLEAGACVVGRIKRAAMLGPIPEDAKRLEAALEDALSYSIEAAVPERREIMLPDHADLVVWLLELLERQPSPSVYGFGMGEVSGMVAKLRAWRAIDPDGVPGVADAAAALIDKMAEAMLAADRRAFLAEKRAIPIELPNLITEVLAGELADSYDCTRVWEAWSVGTMSEEDFEPLSDRVQSITVALMERIAPFSILPEQAAQRSGSGQEPDPEADVASIERVADRLGLGKPEGTA